MHFLIPDGDAPIYQRLADAIKAQIQSGALPPGEKLPTVRKLSLSLGIAGGTIRHAYHYLTDEGWLSVTQGRGTFVCENIAPSSRETAAMNAISHLLDELTALRFTPHEIGLFFQLKLDALDQGRLLTPVAVVERSAEMLGEMAEQLSALPGIELMECLLRDVRSAAPDLFSRYALIITTAACYHELCSLLPIHPNRILRVALTPALLSTISIAHIDPHSRIGIFCRSERFRKLIADAIHQCPHLRSAQPRHCSMDTPANLGAFTADLDVLIVAPNYLSALGDEGHQTLRAFTDRGGRIILYRHQIDQGSCMQIEERLREFV